MRTMTKVGLLLLAGTLIVVAGCGGNARTQQADPTRESNYALAAAASCLRHGPFLAITTDAEVRQARAQYEGGSSSGDSQQTLRNAPPLISLSGRNYDEFWLIFEPSVRQAEQLDLVRNIPGSIALSPTADVIRRRNVLIVWLAHHSDGVLETRAIKRCLASSRALTNAQERALVEAVTKLLR